MFRTRMFKDYFLLIQGRVQVRPYSNPEELEFKVTSVTQLQEVRDALREVRLFVPTTKLSREFIDKLHTVVKHSKGRANLKFVVRDEKEDVSLTACSRKYKVALTSELAEFIEENGLQYVLN